MRKDVKLTSYLKPYMPAIVIALLCATVGAVFSIIGPDYIKDITNKIASGLMGEFDLEGVERICFILVGFYVTGAVLSYVQSYIMATVTLKFSKGLRREISFKMNRLPLKYFDSTTFGDVLSRVTNDVDTLSQTLNQSIVTLVTAVTLFFGSLFMMFKTNWIMAVTAIVSSLIGFFFMSLVIGRSQKFFMRQQKELGAINGHVEEIYSGHNIIKAYNAEERFKEQFETINQNLYESGWKAQFLSGLMMPFMGFVGNFGYVAVCVVGAALTMNDVIDFGVIVAFMMYVRLFTQPLSQMAQAATSLQSASAASKRVFDFLGEEELSDESHKTMVLTDVKGEVEFSHVKFGYDPEKIIIKDFSAKALPGQKVAIVGPTGAGKTTLVNLLMRFYELNEGEIKIDGVTLTDLTRENIHDLFGMVLQDTWMFQGTIRDNLVYSKKDVTDEDIEKACKAVGIHHFIKTLPNGYDTIMDDSANLSAGQKQLITIARAMVENAPLIILDEATSSVDTRTEVLIQEAMDRLTKGRTTFVIAHRLSTIKNADLILVMRDGDIVESGKHEELLAKGGFYAELYNSQFER
ncbi:MAG: ABC transporter ATP-binding protein [Lachnospiraceae bacterium]|nr:ABC transporter ATP-binding protein [Lachnospiraceae bacterium]